MALWDFRGGNGPQGYSVTYNCSIGGSSTQFVITAVSSQGYPAPLYATAEGLGIATNPDHEVGHGQKIIATGISNMTSASIGGNVWAILAYHSTTNLVFCENTLASSVGNSVRTTYTYPSTQDQTVSFTMTGVSFSSFATGFQLYPSGVGGMRLATIGCT